MSKRRLLPLAPLLLLPFIFWLPRGENGSAHRYPAKGSSALAFGEGQKISRAGNESRRQNDQPASPAAPIPSTLNAGDFLSRWHQEMSSTEVNPCATALWPWDEYPRQIALLPLEEKIIRQKSCPAEPLWRFLVAAGPAEAAASLANASHPGLRFFRALTLAGMMEGAGFTGTPPIDLALARRILLDLVRADPTNGAPLQFLAVVEAMLGASSEKSISLFEASFSRVKFNLYGVELWQCLIESSGSDLRYYFVNNKAIESAPYPAYWRVVKAASDLVPIAPPAFFRRMEESSVRALALFENEKSYGAARFYEDAAFKHAKAMQRVAYRGLGKDHTSLPLPSESFAWPNSETEAAREYAFPPKEGCRPDDMPRYAEILAGQIRAWQKHERGN